jgi:phage minor structural protein
LQFIKVVRNSQGKYVLPMSSIDENVIEREYIYYNKNELENCIDKDTLKPIYSTKDIEPDDRFIPKYYDTAEKVRSVKVKESNYFNALQSICETFQTWIKFIINRDSTGKILSKEIAFKNYIGKENYTGFKYGINLKSISRNVDSKNIVTKMIVKNNANESAKNGYCSITRAGGNETGENYIYDFSYYMNHGLIDG